MSKAKRATVSISIITSLLIGGLALWWATYPRHPDLATTPVDQAVAFVGTNDFNQMSASQRRQYCLDVAEKLRERTFPELLAMVAARNSSMKQVADNVDKSGARDDVDAAMLRVVLDKFYDEPPAKRAIYLWGLVKMQQSGAAGGEGIGLPSAKQLQSDMTRVLVRQPPQTVAKMGQFIQDLQTQRRGMGVPDPY